MIISIIEKIEIMFEQYCVHHNCSKNDDMKNITRPCSCDLSFGEKACPRETSYCNTGISSKVNTKCISKCCNKSFYPKTNFRCFSNLCFDLIDQDVKTSPIHYTCRKCA